MGERVEECDTNDRWHLAWNGPRQVTQHMPLERGQVLVEFHDQYEVVKAEELFRTEAECYTAAWLKKLSEVQCVMAVAGQFKERADKLRKEASK